MTAAPSAPHAPDAALVARAAELADTVLFPGAAETDAAPLVPRARLDALAAADLYGLLGPRAAGGLDASGPTAVAVLEELARGCLTTAFVYTQHHNAVRTLAGAPDGPAAHLLGPLCRGELRAGVAFSGLRRPDPPPIVARRAGAGRFVLVGSAAWVTGWGRIDYVHVGARTEDGDVLWALVPAAASRQLTATPLTLGAVGASGTVALDFDGLVVEPASVTLVEPYAAFQARDALGLRPNGAFALGLARRCAELAGTADPAIDACRERLDAAGPDALAAARADACLTAVAAAARLVATGGGRSVVAGAHAERLWREAGFLLVFGQTAAIRAATLENLAAAAGAPAAR